MLRPLLRSPLRDPLTTGQGVRVTPTLRNVATRCAIPNVLSTTLKYANARRAHYARDAIASLQIVIPNFYVKATAATGEAGTGGTATVSASIEYPLGTRTQVLFSGVATGSIPNNSYIVSDAVAVSIPKDALFYVWLHWENASGFPYRNYTGNNPGVFASDGYEYSASSLADKTMSGTIANNSPTNTNVFGCCAIIAMSKRPAVLLIGDSRCLGTRDSNVAGFGDLGEVEKSIGPSLAVANYGISSLTAQGWNNSHANQVALAQYFQNIVIQIGVNDLYSGASAATLITRNTTIAGNFTGKRIFYTTIPPETTSTDNWATEVNQTPVSVENDTQRKSYNASVRAGLSGAYGYFEIADVVESARDSGIWKAGYTPDGVHENATATAAIKASGNINATVFAAT